MRRIFAAFNPAGKRRSRITSNWQGARKFFPKEGELLPFWTVKELINGEWVIRKHANDKGV